MKYSALILKFLKLFSLCLCGFPFMVKNMFGTLVRLAQCHSPFCCIVIINVLYLYLQGNISILSVNIEVFYIFYIVYLVCLFLLIRVCYISTACIFLFSVLCFCCMYISIFACCIFYCMNISIFFSVGKSRYTSIFHYACIMTINN